MKEKIFTIIAGLVACTMLTACPDPEPNPTPNPKNDETEDVDSTLGKDDDGEDEVSIVGSWKLDFEEDGEYMVFTFNRDGRCEIKAYSSEEYIEGISGRYTLKKDVLTVSGNGEVEVYTILNLTEYVLTMRVEGKYVGDFAGSGDTEIYTLFRFDGNIGGTEPAPNPQPAPNPDDDDDDDDDDVMPGTTGYLNGHKWVDLGLSVNWADCNLGANSPEESGIRLKWGSTNPSETTNDYMSSSGTFSELGNLYNISGTKFDAATQMWGEGWRMPTNQEFKELMDLFDFKYDIWLEDWPSDAQKFFGEINGVTGVKMWGKTGNYVFFPIEYTYWTADRASGYGKVYMANFNPYGAGLGAGFSCCVEPWGDENLGMHIRPVCDK